MSSDDAHQPRQPAPIKVPDQLQQTQRSNQPKPNGVAPPGGRKREAAEAPPREGILGQLETERAHD